MEIRTMEIGRVYDVVSLFSKPQRDFLIRSNGEKVKVDSLKGKIVAIYFISLVEEEDPNFEDESKANRPIKEVYDDLSPQNNFEVVLVARVYDGDEGEDKKLFDKLFSRMPFLAIPQDDKESRRELFSKIDYPEVTPRCPILDDKGKILYTDAIPVLSIYGAECYPFTPERIIEICDDDMSARFAMSLKRLLTTPSRDFLLRSNNSQKVTVSDLEGKVVAFYSYTGCNGTVSYLKDLYEKLQQMGKQFEIVFINSRRTEDRKSYMKALKWTPFLGLPSNDRSYLKLMRIFDCSPGELVIFRPGENFPDTYGKAVLDHYGIEAYPFTRRSVAEKEVERLKSLTLDSMLFSGDCKYIEGKGEQKVTAHHLENKTILLLFTTKNCPDCRRLVPRLVTWYNETKERVKEDVEIIHIPYNYDPAKECCYGTMPWLQFPYNEKYNQKLFLETLRLYRCLPTIIAIGADGKIVNMTVERKFLSEGWDSKIEYPFTFDVDFFSQVERNVASMMCWPLEEYRYAKMFSPISRYEHAVNQGRKKMMKKSPQPMPGEGGKRSMRRGDDACRGDEYARQAETMNPWIKPGKVDG